MNEQLETVLDLPLKVKVGILAGTLFVLLGGFYFLFYSSSKEQLDTLTESIEGVRGLKQQIAQKEGIAKNLDKYIEEVKRLDGELKKALAELPDRKEIAQLLSKISDKAKDSGLEIQLFKPQSEQKKDFYSEVPVEIQVAGTFHQVATFFDEVGRLERIVNLDQFGITDPQPADNNKIMLKTSVMATSFRFLEESERPQEDESTAGKRRRGGKPEKEKAERPDKSKKTPRK